MKSKKIISVKKLVFYILVFLLFGIQTDFAKNSITTNYPPVAEKKVRVVFIFYLKDLHKKVEVHGTLFDSKEKVLIGIVKYSYFDKSENVQKFKRSYKNHELHPGFVIGHPYISNEGIYVEPKKGDKFQIYARTDSRGQKIRTPRIPIACEKKGEKCLLKSSYSNIQLTVINDRWNSTNKYSSLSTYKINTLFNKYPSLANNNRRYNEFLRFSQILSKNYNNRLNSGFVSGKRD